MENNGMHITQPFKDGTRQRGDMQITMKPGSSDETLFHNIVLIMEWAKTTNGNDPQKIMDWIKEKNFFSELVYNPQV